MQVTEEPAGTWLCPSCSPNAAFYVKQLVSQRPTVDAAAASRREEQIVGPSSTREEPAKPNSSKAKAKRSKSKTTAPKLAAKGVAIKKPATNKSAAQKLKPKWIGWVEMSSDGEEEFKKKVEDKWNAQGTRRRVSRVEPEGVESGSHRLRTRAVRKVVEEEEEEEDGSRRLRMRTARKVIVSDDDDDDDDEKEEADGEEPGETDIGVSGSRYTDEEDGEEDEDDDEEPSPRIHRASSVISINDSSSDDTTPTHGSPSVIILGDTTPTPTASSHTSTFPPHSPAPNHHRQSPTPTTSLKSSHDTEEYPSEPPSIDVDDSESEYVDNDEYATGASTHDTEDRPSEDPSTEMDLDEFESEYDNNRETTTPSITGPESPDPHEWMDLGEQGPVSAMERDRYAARSRDWAAYPESAVRSTLPRLG